MSAVPKLRFPEFHEALKTSALKDKFIHIRNGFVGTATPYYVTKGVPYIQGKDIKLGTISFRKNLFVSQEFHEKYSKSILKFRDLVMVQSGHVGECAVVPKNLEGSNCHALIILTPNEGVSSDWVAQFFFSPHGKKKIYKVKTGNTIEHILASDMQKMELFFPSLPEQQKIASFLSSVDKKIDLLRQKKDALELYKKGLMQKIFSHEIRFKQDDGSDFPDWEEVALGDVLAKFETGKSKSKNLDPEGDFIVIDMGGVDRQCRIVSGKRIGKNQDLLEFGQLVMPKDDIGGGNIIGKVVFVDESEKYVLGDHVYALTVDLAKADQKFLFYRINSSQINTSLRKKANGTAQLGLGRDAVLKQEIKICCIAEQRKIASFLSALDAKIQNTSSQIEQMETFKKGLLQQMFV